MGLFDKVLKSVIETAVDAITNKEEAPAERPQEQVSYEEESGFSWGSKMPDEPNQFNYPGPWTMYFMSVFKEYFPQYEIRRETGTDRSVIFMFRQNELVALYVEVMDENSEANSFRKRCREAGIPYVRFYYNHKGWWNTKQYVCTRVREALEG